MRKRLENERKTYTTDIESCNPSDCASCTANCSSAGGNNQGTIPKVPNPTIKLTLEDDTVLECAVLTTFPVEGFGEYIALVPLNENGKNTDWRNILIPLRRRK